MRLRACKKRAAALMLPALPGCSGVQSALDPAGPQAQALAEATWIMAAGAGVIFAVVMLLALYAVYRNPQRRRPVSSTALIVGGGVIFPVVVLTALLVYGIGLMGALRAGDGEALRIEVVAHMWWWEVRYPGEGGPAVTANDIRIPLGRPVRFVLSSPDVIHSFWMPTLAGKIDVIPGRVTELILTAERAGSYRGQCAEFCGAQHALMAFNVVVLEPEAFERWLAALRAPARAAAGAVAERGREAFLDQGCAHCHTVRGVAQSRVPGPDLTHLAQRPWLGAGALPNTHEGRVRWLADGEGVKPGRAMPSYAHLQPATLHALAEFLGGLE